VFDRDGHFIRQIGKVGMGPGEYVYPDDFTIDKENKIIYILDERKRQINKYYLNTGLFIHAINLDPSIRIANIEHIGGTLFADAYFDRHSKDNYLLCIIDEITGKEESHYLNVMKYNKTKKQEPHITRN